MKRIIFGCILSVIFYSCKSKQDESTVQTEVTASAAGKTEMLSLNGSSPDLSKYKGKFVFINYWATWCKPCVSEMPSLQRLTEKMKAQNIVFLFASDETEEEIAAFKSANNYTMEFVRIESLGDLNISAIPFTQIFDNHGVIAFTQTGAREWDSEESIAMITKAIGK